MAYALQSIATDIYIVMLHFICVCLQRATKTRVVQDATVAAYLQARLCSQQHWLEQCISAAFYRAEVLLLEKVEVLCLGQV